MKTAVTLFWILFAGLSAAWSAETTSGDRTLSPYFWVKTTGPGSDGPGVGADPLPLKSTRVEATIAGVFADVKVTQHYANTGTVPLEAVYVFPGSTRAAVHGLTLFVGDRRLEAKTKERAEARRTYEAAKSAGKTASLLEQQRPNVFQMNVANILPGDDVSVELRYTELLVPDHGVYEFVYPGVVGPRYSNKPAPGAPPEDTWVQNPYLHKGEQDPTGYSLRVDVAGSMPLQDVRCRSHAPKVDYRGQNEAVVSLDDPAGANRDFVLSYRLAGGAIQSGLFLGEGKDEKFFLLMVQPPARPTLAQVPPREFVFILDVSGSMNGFPLQTAKGLIRELLESLRPQDSFNVLLFAGASDLFSPSSVPATPEAIRAALQRIDEQQGSGGTELLPALKRALSLPQSEGVSRSFVVITDGYVDVEAESFRLVRENAGRANLFAFGIGSSVNRFLIEGLARSGQGEPFVVTDPEAGHEAAGRFRDYVSMPLLTGVRVKMEGFEAYDLEPGACADLLAERPLIVMGKWRGERTGHVVVTGNTGTAPYRSEHDMTTATVLPDAGGLSRLWARARIAELGDLEGARDGGDQKAAITQLGLTYNLLTKYTSFVAVDEIVRRSSPTLQTVKQPLPLPAGVENSAVGYPVAAAPEPSTVALVIVGLIVLLAALWRNRRLKIQEAGQESWGETKTK
ncbi:trypsin [Opitutaceae bacterium EW11]|nr:trypsin [Opitutaceae bacterium EW11]